MNFRDDPAHARLREPVRAAFTPRRAGAFEADVRAIVEGAIDAFPRDGEVELYEAFARPIPARVIASLLGAEPEDSTRFMRWSADLAAIVFSLAPSAVDEAPLVSATREFASFFGALVERERARPSGNLLSALVHSEVGELGPLELVGACTLLLFGGHETTTNLIDNALALLLERPELAHMLRVHPERWDTAIDELMRVVGPARTMARKVAVAHERAGQSLAPGRDRLPRDRRREPRPRRLRGPGRGRLRAHAEPAHGLRLGPALLPGREPRAARGAHRAADLARALPEAARDRSRSRRSAARRWATRAGSCT